MIKKREKSLSIATRFVIIAVLAILCQTTFSALAIWQTRAFVLAEENAYETFEKNIENYASYIEIKMINNWSAIHKYKESAEEVYAQMDMQGSEISEEQAVEFLDANTELVKNMIAATDVTGGFIILNDGGINKDSTNSGIYLDSGDVLTSAELDFSGIQMQIGPSEISRKYKIPLANMWSYGLNLNDNGKAAVGSILNQSKVDIDSKHLGSWGAPRGNLTYTLPLIDNKGNAFGIIGTTISKERIYGELPVIDENEGYSYFLASENLETNKITPIITNGTAQKTIAPIGEEMQIEGNPFALCGTIETVYGKVVTHFEELEIYSPNSPFELKKLYVGGIISEEDLTSFARDFQMNMILALFMSLFFGMFIALFMGHFLAHPINKLTAEINNIEKDNLKKISPTGIKELDEISHSIKQMTTSLTNSLSKTDKILDSLHMGVGTFEHCDGDRYVTISRRLLDILDISKINNQTNEIEYNYFVQTISQIKKRPEPGFDSVYQLAKNKNSWVQIISSHEGSMWWGVIVDTTNEVLERRARAYKVDYDQLTGIYNRGAFINKSNEILKDKSQKCIALAMFDLDNLKYVNDNFGHDLGDVYITSTARIMQETLGEHAIVARVSGDEFLVLVYDALNKADIVARVESFYHELDKRPIVLSNGSEYKIRISCGIAWYKEDAENLEELIRYADFAMYQVKHDTKGEMKMYDKQQYHNESFLLRGGEELNNILDNGLIDFYFQPIVTAKDGEVYGYEALMRPQSDILNTPYKLLKIASSQSQLNKVEKVTFFNALEAYKNNSSIDKTAKLFINSIPNRALKSSEYDLLEEKYSEFLENLVIEIIENEQLDVETLEIKRKRVKKWKGQIALDDYGSGYSGDSNLLAIKPAIVKIDCSVIYSIERDTSRQAILAKTISFCHDRGIKVVAEGIETQDQLDYLISAGVDLLQGYYIAKPQLNSSYNKNDKKYLFIKNKN